MLPNKKQQVILLAGGLVLIAAALGALFFFHGRQASAPAVRTVPLLRGQVAPVPNTGIGLELEEIAPAPKKIDTLGVRLLVHQGNKKTEYYTMIFSREPRALILPDYTITLEQPDSARQTLVAKVAPTAPASGPTQ